MVHRYSDKDKREPGLYILTKTHQGPIKGSEYSCVNPDTGVHNQDNQQIESIIQKKAQESK